MKKLIMLIVCLVVFGAVLRVRAESYNSVVSGLWQASTTWAPLGVPQDTDDVTITNHTVSLSEDAHAELLSNNGGTIDAATHSLIIDSVTDVYGSGYLRNGRFNLSTLNLSNGWAEDGIFNIGVLNLSGGIAESNTMNISTFNWTGGRINDSHLIVANGSFNSSSTLYLDNSLLQITGTFSQGNTGMIRLYGTGSIITNAGIWQLTNNEKPFDSTGSFVNEGTFKKSGGTGSSEINVGFSDQAGTVQVDSGTLSFNGYSSSYVFSNTTFAVASGSSAYFPYGATFKGAINGSGGGVLSLGGIYGTCYFIDSCSLDMGTGMIRWSRGSFRDSIFSTLSSVEFVGNYTRSLVDSTWTISGGLTHKEGTVSLLRSVLNISSGSTYDIRLDGGPISNSSGGRVDLAGTLAKSAGVGTATINAPIYGDGAMMNVSTGMLSLTGDCRLYNTKVVLATNTTWRPGGVNSNATIVADGKGTISFYNNYVTAVGLWSLTNTDISVYLYYSSDALYVSPSLTLEGENSSFRFSQGTIRDGIITNRIPFEITSSGGARTLFYCHIHSFADTDVNYAGTTFSRSTWHNYPGVEYRMNVDGDIFGAVTESTYFNEGTFRKAAGSGVSGTDVKFIDTDGIIAVDTGTLWLSSYDSKNEFYNTAVTLASGTTFRMSGRVCSNMTITAAGPATVQVASDGQEQVINTDLAITGPVAVQLLADYLTMTGTVSGAEASFEWRGGRLEDCKMTNAVPCLFSGTATRYVTDSQFTITAGAIHTNAVIYISRSSIYNATGSVYQIASDGDILRNSAYGYFRNQGSFIKTGGNGTTDIKALFQNQEGTIGAERGLLKFTAALDLTNGEVQVDLGGVSDYGRIQSTAAVDVNGSILTVALRDGYTPVVGDSFVVLTGSPLTGTFTATNLPTLYSGDFWNVDYDSSTVKLTVASPEDSDGDLMKDSWEIEKFGSITVSNGGDDNSDTDIVTDYHEYIADTDPTNPASYFCLTAVSNPPAMTLYFLSSSNRLYSMDGCSNLVSGTWGQVSGNGPRAGIGGADFMQDTNVPAEGPYYRMKVELLSIVPD